MGMEWISTSQLKGTKLSEFVVVAADVEAYLLIPPSLVDGDLECLRVLISCRRKVD